MKYTFSILALALSIFGNAHASDLHLAPANFTFKDGQAVFIDFQSALTTLQFDGATKSGTAKTEITFVQEHEGYPLFDLVTEPTSVLLDGQAIGQQLVASPDGATQYRAVLQKLQPGTHTLVIENPYGNDVAFKDGGVAAAFFFIDWTDRSYIEQYLPTNTEFDQYSASITLSFKNLEKGAAEHDIFANGKVTLLDATTARIDFPKFYNCASFYLQMAPVGQFTSKSANFKSMDGRVIPITTFKKEMLINLNKFQDEAARVLTELEKDYGPFPHDKVVIYADYGGGKPGLGGMEYAGATITALEALSHELFHSYHGRSMAPADGNSGWMDEAIAVWRDKGYREALRSTPIVTNIAGRQAYIRFIGMEPYSEGEVFMRHLGAKATAQNRSLKTFLRDYWTARKFTIVNTNIFQSDLEAATGLNLKKDFASWIYGQAPANSSLLESSFKLPSTLNPNHRVLNAAERKRLL